MNPFAKMRSTFYMRVTKYASVVNCFTKSYEHIKWYTRRMGSHFWWCHSFAVVLKQGLHVDDLSELFFEVKQKA